MSDEQWGPWIVNPGEQPVADYVIVEVFTVDDESQGFVSDPKPANYWCWMIEGGGKNDIIRYRIRKPRALIEMIESIETLPERQDA